MAAPIIVTASGNGNISSGNVFPTSHANYTNDIAFYLENVTRIEIDQSNPNENNQ